MVDVGVVSLPSGHQAFRTPSKPVIDIPRSYDTGHSTQFHRSMSTAIRQQSLHRSSQHRLQPTEPQLTRQRLRPVLSQTIGHPRRRLAVGRRASARRRTPVLHRDRDDYGRLPLCLRPCPKSLRLESRLRVYRVLTGDTDGYQRRFSSSLANDWNRAQIPDSPATTHSWSIYAKFERTVVFRTPRIRWNIVICHFARDSSSSESSPPNLSSLAAPTS